MQLSFPSELSFFVFVMTIATTRCGNVKTQKNNHQNISLLLDNLLRGYDNSIRPDFGGNYTRYTKFTLFPYNQKHFKQFYL